MRGFWLLAALTASVCLVAFIFWFLGYRPEAPAPQITNIQLPTI